MSLKGKQVLLVDDEVDLLELLNLELKVIGATVEKATCYDDAVDLLKKSAFDIVLSDIRMPGRDGLALLEHCKTNYPETAVALMTGFADVSTESVMAKGAVSKLEKPFSRQQLAAVLTRYVKQGPELWQLPLDRAPSAHWHIKQDCAHAPFVQFGRGGVCLLHDQQEVPVGSSASLVIENAFKDRSLFAMSGVVEWCRPLNQLVGYGVSYAGLDFDAVAALAKFLKRQPTTAFIPAAPQSMP